MRIDPSRCSVNAQTPKPSKAHASMLARSESQGSPPVDPDELERRESIIAALPERLQLTNDETIDVVLLMLLRHIDQAGRASLQAHRALVRRPAA